MHEGVVYKEDVGKLDEVDELPSSLLLPCLILLERFDGVGGSLIACACSVQSCCVSIDAAGMLGTFHVSEMLLVFWEGRSPE